MSPLGRLAADLWTAPPNTTSTAAREDIWQPLCIWHVGQQCQHPVASNFLEASNVSRDQCQSLFWGPKMAQKCGLKKQSIPRRLENSFPKPISWVFLCTKWLKDFLEESMITTLGTGTPLARALAVR